MSGDMTSNQKPNLQLMREQAEGLRHNAAVMRDRGMRSRERQLYDSASLLCDAADEIERLQRDYVDMRSKFLAAAKAVGDKCSEIEQLQRAADEPKATDEGVADARRWIAYLESEPQHEPDISIARVLRDLVQFYEWALPQITNRTAEPPADLLREVVDALECRDPSEAHYCPNCDRSLYDITQKVRASLTKSEIPAAAQSAANSGQCESRKAAQSGTAAGASDETPVHNEACPGDGVPCASDGAGGCVACDDGKGNYRPAVETSAPRVGDPCPACTHARLSSRGGYIRCNNCGWHGPKDAP